MNSKLEQQIHAQWNSRTKPVGSLGRLETLVTQYCLLRREVLPPKPRIGVYLFAGDHGITEAGVSAYPMSVTAQMVKNIRAGGAAVSVLVQQHGMTLEVIDCGVGKPTKNFALQEAMDEGELDKHLESGKQLARDAAERFSIVAVGEMGIGNTSAASAVTAALLDLRAADVVGPGAGLDLYGLSHKTRVLERALELHAVPHGNGRKALQCFGGHEMARMAGFLLGAAEIRLPVMMDGFITGATALAAIRMEPKVRAVLLFSHRSAERGHHFLLDAMAAEPFLDLQMRLGEATGAILALSLLESGWHLYTGMASFDSAKISGKVNS